MEILFVSPEVVPFSKVGGLADVVGSLPKALRALGHRVQVLSLRYANVDPGSNQLARRLTRLQVPVGDETLAAEVYEARLPSGIQVTLLNAPGLTDRAQVYGEVDDDRRFAFLTRGAVEWMKTQPKVPDIVHAHGWATGLLPLFVKTAAETDPRLRGVRTVFTVHDVRTQGLFPRESLDRIGVPHSAFTPEGLEFHGNVSWLKGGVVFADRVTTLSPAYARDLQTPPGGEGLEGVFRSRGRDFTGITNGVDFAVWNPATDPFLAARFDAEDATAKERCKIDLATRAGFTPRANVPMIGYVGRFDASKGFDLLLEAAPRMMRQDFQWVLLGEGEGALSKQATDLAQRFPDRVFVQHGFDDAMAHRIYGGSDFLLVPSRHEPGGLTHLYGMRYGAIPVVHATGAMKDSVIHCDPELETGHGFVFDQPDADALFGAFTRALSAYRQGEAFAQLRRRVMRKDLSWERSARQYQSLYQSLLTTDGHPTPSAV